MSWLVLGHGSVGSALVRRLTRAGIQPLVYDPAPRVPVEGAEHTASLPAGGRVFDRVISCVVPSAALRALADCESVLHPATLYLDWNTLAPETKRAVAAAAPCPVVDVALLDTLDEEAARPTLAVSGGSAEVAASLLSSLGFHVDVVGSAPGDAALLKFARSLFMKTLEALVIEFEAAVATLPGRPIVRDSIERNLGPRFMDFARMLVETDRVHASRRSDELAEAAVAYRGVGASVDLASAAVEVLRAAARAWASPDAPSSSAGAPVLAGFLAGRLGGGPVRAGAPDAGR